MSNNKKPIIIGLLILFALGAIVTVKALSDDSMTNNSGESTSNEQVTEIAESKESTNSNNQAVNGDSTTAYNEVVKVQAPANSTKYILNNNSEASYTVTKVFVGKPSATVVGVTKEVNGGGWFDNEGKKFYLRAVIGLDKLKSDSEKRDSDILPLFTPATAVIVVNGDNATDAISMTEPFETQVTADLTVGNVTRPVVFDVKGMVDENKFSAEGTTQVKMSDFGITPPTALNIFSVEDDTTLKFVVEGDALKEEAPQPQQ